MARNEFHPSLALVLSQNEPEHELSSAELQRLLDGLSIRTVATIVQRKRPGAASFSGEGKLEEIAARLQTLREQHPQSRLVLAVDTELRPGQMRQLERRLEVPVIDRVGVVLATFEQRARTPTAAVEVELARLRYEAPRVRDDESLGDREGGGGRGGRGNSNVALEKERIRRRIAELEHKLEQLTAAEEKQRNEREGGLHVALVGYTNAGKSSLMRGLTGSEIHVADQLFATLGSKVRALHPPSAPPTFLSDTVGFLRRLPAELIASFRSTLAEARHADLLLHVVDASDPSWRKQRQVTRESLEVVGAGEVPELLVFNKADRLHARERELLLAEAPDALLISAFEQADLSRLRHSIAEALEPRLARALLGVPHTQGRMVAEIRSRARILAEADTPAGTLFSLLGLPADVRRWQRQLDATAEDRRPA